MGYSGPPPPEPSLSSLKAYLDKFETKKRPWRRRLLDAFRRPDVFLGLREADEPKPVAWLLEAEAPVNPIETERTTGLVRAIKLRKE